MKTHQVGLTNQLAPDTVTLQTALVRFDEAHQLDLQSTWAAADESTLDFELRKLLDANGIRVGVLRGELPKPLTEQIEQARQRQKTDISEQLGLSSDADVHSLTWVCKAGRRKELIVRRELTKPLLVTTLQGASVVGKVYDKAVTVLGMTVYPQPDGKALIELTPEVQYGEPRNTIVSGEFGMRQELKRDSKVWKQFRIRTLLSNGEMLIISSTNPTKALGHAFFTTETNQQTEDQIAVLIRLSTNQIDTLFAEDVSNKAKSMMDSR